jgi:alpha-D-ribose 1-methylphosphonate 5-triphosphate synthase subunit PhnH
MSLASPITEIGAAFGEPALASQRVFRGALEALSRPGRIVQVASDAQPPAGLQTAAAALALALLDQDTRLWLAGTGTAEAAAFLRFHTGCTIAGDPGEADFALLPAALLPPLESFACGSEEYPDRSATLIVQAASLHGDEGWQLSGPGIRDTARLRVGGLGAGFAAQWARNGRRFPCGVDLFFTCGEQLCALPRTTRIGA